MTIPSRPAPPPPTQQQQQQQQRQQIMTHQNNDRGGYGASQGIIKLPPPPTSNTSVKLNHTKCGKTTTSLSVSNQDSVPVSSSITRKFPTAKTRYTPIENLMNDDPFEMVSNVKKKIPPPRPPPPMKDLSYGAVDTVLKKPGPPQSVSMLSNIFGKKKSNNKSLTKQQQQFPPNKYPPLSSSNLVKSNQTYQSRPYAFVPPLIRNNNENRNELINFDSPPNSPILMKKSNSDCISVDSFSSNSNFSSPNESVSQSESGFEDDFLSPPDPWETLINGAFIKDNTTSQLITQPVRNLNAINNLKGDDFLSNGKSLLPPPSTLAMPTIIKPKTQAPKKNPAPKPPPGLIKENDEENELNLYESNSPPMPSCPPPPPPPLVADDIDPSQPSYGIALYTFEGLEEGDLPFKENEKVYILQKLNDNWYFGRNKRGCEGIFPSNYIEIKIPLRENDVAAAAAVACSSASNNETTGNNRESNRKARSLYNFVAEVPEDLSLNENDIITVLYQISNEWLYGEIDGRRGQFPANFVEFL